MVVKKRIILWDWTNSPGPGNPGNPHGMHNIHFGNSSPVASVINWNAWAPPELEGRAPFRPMVRDMGEATGQNWDMIENTPFPIVLFFNEPERANISPEQARDIWYAQMLPLRRDKGKQLGSPAVASDDNGKIWLTQFMSLVASDPPDYLCLHWYSDDSASAQRYLEEMHNEYSQYPVMVTEIACTDRDHEKVTKFTSEMCDWLDRQDWVFEYGFFVFQRTVPDDFVSPAAQLIRADGHFTTLGHRYLHAQPF